MKHALFLILFASSAAATEQPLGFTVTGKTVEPGTHELVASSTLRFGRPRDYLRVESLAGFGYGFSKSIEAQVLIAIAVESAGLDRRAAEGGGQVRLRWQPLEGRADALGLGLVGTVGLSPTSVFVEARLNVEKWFGEFLFALNASVDYRVRRDDASGPGLHLEQSAGVVYRLANNFTTGVEFRNRLGFERGSYYGAAIFAGPVLGYRSKSAWFSLAALPQVAAVKAQSQVGNGEALELRDNERVVVRLQLGFDL